MLELRAQYSLFDDTCHFLLRDRQINSVAIGRVTFEKLEDGGYLTEPSFKLSMDMAQALMDELWRNGLRPTEGKQSEGMFEAQGRHLDDMRAIAFAKLKISAPLPNNPKHGR